MEVRMNDVLDQGQFPGTYQRVVEATEHIRRYTDDPKRFPINGYSVGVEGYRPTIPVTPPAADGFAPYRGCRYCFPFDLRRDPTPDMVAEVAALSAAKAMLVRTLLGTALLTTVPNWNSHVVPGDVEHLELWSNLIRDEMIGSGANPDDLVLVMNSNRADKLFRSSVWKLPAFRAFGCSVVVDNAWHTHQSKSGKVWPDNVVVLAYVPSGDDKTGATLRFDFAERTQVETKTTDTETKGRVIEDYRVSMDPVFGVLFQF